MNLNVILAGVGGQGTVLASRIIAKTALDAGLAVRSSETIGMAQRGGSVMSHVRIGASLFSPLVSLGQADLVIGFEPAEAARALPYLKPGGAVVVSAKAVMPFIPPRSTMTYHPEQVLDFLQREIASLVVVDAEGMATRIGSPKVQNVILLGAALGSGHLGFSEAAIEASLRAIVKEKFHQMNLRALHEGAEAATRK